MSFFFNQNLYLFDLLVQGDDAHLFSCDGFLKLLKSLLEDFCTLTHLEEVLQFLVRRGLQVEPLVVSFLSGLLLFVNLSLSFLVLHSSDHIFFLHIHKLFFGEFDLLLDGVLLLLKRINFLPENSKSFLIAHCHNSGHLLFFLLRRELKTNFSCVNLVIF